ncbi:RNA polymerase sigma factor [Streptomyces sp. NPDC020875]|uniref:RNA polymerase sigma factor n=1 Tax=Streptomyces sp. NPDC020875 TaxID=3154898 RepID=UPI0033EB3EBB
MTAASAVETVFRIEQPRVIAAAARIVRDVGTAEEIAQDALVSALEQWPAEGVPAKPGAWLVAVAKRRAIDLVRRRENYANKLAEVGRARETAEPPPPEPSDDTGTEADIDDDLLRLIFTACHPVLPTQARIALTLRLLGGLTTDEIARAFLASEPAVAQRIVRAKRTLAGAGVPFEVPYGPDRAARIGSVLEVVYLVFNEGYSATKGDDWVRPALCEEALRLARVLAGLLPDDAEVHGLAALLEIQASRIPARTGPGGEPVLIADQNRARWDGLLIRRGFAALDRAGAAGSRAGAVPGPYTLQAAIAACHARAVRYEDTDWAMIATLYGRLAAVAPSPVVEVNRAVAVGMAHGPEAGLAVVDAVADDPGLREYHPLPGVRGDLLARLGRTEEAAEEFRRAAALSRNARERALFLTRATSPHPPPDPPFRAGAGEGY